MDLTSPRVAEPFASDRGFWTSLQASRMALVTLVVAVALTAGLGMTWAITFAVPAVLLVVAGVVGRSSAARSKAAFTTAAEWRDAERQAVASAFIPRRSSRPS